MESLPAVAKNVYHHCQKCGTDRYHRVLAHLSSTQAKIECEVCHSKKKLSIGSKMATKKTATTTKKTTTRHSTTWAELKEKYSDLPTESYNIGGSFRPQTLIAHPTFGVGVIMEAHPNKIEVCFEDGMKTLMHRRG